MNQILSHKGKWYLKSDTGYKEILATTNPDLWWDESDIKYGGEPEPTSIKVIPQPLIEYFVEKQGNVKEIMVEYYTTPDYNKVLNSEAYTGKEITNYILNTSGEIIWKPVEEKMYTWNDIEKAYLIGYLQQTPSVLNFHQEVEVHKKKLNQLKEWFDNLPSH